jgi:hypothetical protein
MTAKTWNIGKGKAFKITEFSSNFSSAQQTMTYEAVVISSDSITDGAVGLCKLQGSNLFRMLSFFIFCTMAHIHTAA